VFGDRVNAVFIGSSSTFGVLGKIATLKDADLKELFSHFHTKSIGSPDLKLTKFIKA
jgi:hypothetical protein